MNCKKILNYLYSLETSKIKLGLENIQMLLHHIGNPEKQLKCIHIAGTNGKGSVCSLIFYSLQEAEYKVGMYTSPHLKRFNERIRINKHLITDKEIANCFLKIKPFITNQSFFEITTAMAFLYFKEKNVDFVVLEVGLGGRLDATNVVNPLISVITNVGLEHTELLGNKIEKIAFEKAGIIKNNVPVVTGVEGKPFEVVKQISKEKNAPLFLAKKHKDVKFRYLNGIFQQQNKDIALTVIDILRKFYFLKIRFFDIQSGIKKTKWKGRLEFISKNVLVDCAHNPDGFRVLKKELKIIKNKKNFEKVFFVVGIQKTKDICDMLNIINPLVSSIIFTKSKNEKAANPIELVDIFNKINSKQSIKTKIIKNPRMALKYAKKIAYKNDLIVVTGSIYMVGEVI